MSGYRRYAIYYVPEDGSGLRSFGAAWLGWDIVSGAPGERIEAQRLPVDAADLTREPGRYGFHGTLKPPFRTKAPIGDVIDSTERLVAGVDVFDVPAMKFASIGRFMALIPAERSAALEDLAFALVQGLDHFRLPPTEAELARRRRAGLSARQEELLQRWGYPYVGPEFRFHLTLTGPVDPAHAGAVAEALRPLTAPFEAPLPVSSVALCGEIDGGPHDGRFRVIRRLPLLG